MRITTSMMYDRGLSAVTDRTSKLLKVQDQIARETKILTPADDPAGKAQALSLTERIAQNEQFRKNSEMLLNDLQRQESVMSNVTTSLQRAKELFVQAGNGALSQKDRQSVALEIEVLRDNVLDMMNAQNENGDFLFSGSQAEVRPFTLDPVTGTYQYNGDASSREVQVTPNQTLQSTSSGAEVFQQAPMQLKARVGNFTGDIEGGNTVIADRAAWNNFHQANYDKDNAANNTFRIEFNGGNYEVLDAANNVLDTGAYTPGDPVVFNGMEMQVQGVPANGDSIEFRLSQPKQNAATMLNDMINLLNDPNASQAELSQGIEFGIANLESVDTLLGTARARTGSRMNSAETAVFTNTDFSIANKETRANIQDVDYAEAMTELTKQDTALQAAQATFTRITRLSLFDYLR